MIGILNNSKLNKKHLKILGIVFLLMVLPFILFIAYQIQNTSSRAALPNNLETEQGVLSSNGVSRQSDSQSSGGQYVSFNRGSGPSPTSTPGGLGPRGPVGPRYDLYGAGANGNFPALGTEPSSGAPVSWTASNVYVVPDSVWNSNNIATALSDWIMGRGAYSGNGVPDGESASSPTYIVFDRSQNGQNSTGYGNGTEYNLTGRIILENIPWSTVRRNITFWGYNTKLNYNIADPYNAYGVGLIGFERGGWENINVLGFEFDGPGHSPEAPSWQANGFNGASERDKCINITSYSGFTMIDNYCHHAAGLLAGREWGLGESGGNQHYDGWSHGPYSNDLEIGYNELYYSMNQGVVLNAGWNIEVHHNHIHDMRQKAVDLEDWNHNYVGSLARRMVNVTFRDNRIGNWWWQYPYNVTAWSATQLLHSEKDGVPMLDSIENLQLLRNEFYGGPMGLGNRYAEEQVFGSYAGDTQQIVANRQPAVAATAWTWGINAYPDPANRPDCISVTVRGNISKLPQWLVDLNDVSVLWGLVADCSSVTIEDNDFQDMSWRLYNSTVTSWARNGNSIYHK